jgi:hypothetical protein
VFRRIATAALIAASLTGAAYADDDRTALGMGMVMTSFVSHGSLACGHGQWTDRAGAKRIEVPAAEMFANFTNSELAELTGLGFRKFDDLAAKIGKVKACDNLDFMITFAAVT